MPSGSGALLDLERALQRVVLRSQQPPDRVIADRMPLSGQRLGQLRGRLAGPAQRALRAPAGVGVHQFLQRLQQLGSRSTSRLGPPPGGRTRPRGSGGLSSSRTLVDTVGRDSPMRRAIRAPPPRPRARAAAPASRRRCFSGCFSVRCGATSSYSPASTTSTSTPRRYRPGTPPSQLSDKLVMREPLPGSDEPRTAAYGVGAARPAHAATRTASPKATITVARWDRAVRGGSQPSTIGASRASSG
jgi:hypothetical protein